PIVVLLDCRGWGTGIRALVRGIKAELKDVNLAAVLLTGVEDREHCEVLRQVAAAEELPVVGCLFEAEGPRWDDKAPGAWGLPLEVGFLETVGRQVDVAGLQRLAGQRGFLAVQGWLSDRGVGGPLVLVGGGRGFTPWSRDSIEVLRAAGAQVKRLDLLEDEILPPETAGLVLAGTLWVDTLTEMALNQSLAADIRARMSAGLPTLAMGGGLLYLLERVQDPLGRTHEFAGVLPAEGEILWDLEEPAYVQVSAERDNLLLAQGRTVRGWVTADVEVRGTGAAWDPPLTLRGSTLTGEQAEGAATATLFCTRVFVHLASAPDMAGRFVRQCGLYASSR
ncbi:MAG: hypothetical protein H5T84_04470, partial [Thermoleophilia bacterium]|nr:hypothetical protein [Thermoleophilia bacterium]